MSFGGQLFLLALYISRGQTIILLSVPEQLIPTEGGVVGWRGPASSV